MLETIRPLVEIRVLFLLLALTAAACGGGDEGGDCPTCPTPDPNSAPDVTIDRPSAGSDYLTGESVYLTGGEYELYVERPGSEGWELATTVETSVTGCEAHCDSEWGQTDAAPPALHRRESSL